MKLLIRTKGWRIRLGAYLDAIEQTPHAWGTHDCALGLAAGAIEAMTGEDIAASYRGRYTTPEEALNVLRSEGFETLDALVGTLLPVMGGGDAGIGDLGFVADKESPFGGFLGVLVGERLVVLTPKGKGTLPRTSARTAFRVGG